MPRKEQTYKQRRAAQLNHIIMRLRGALSVIHACDWWLRRYYNSNQENLYKHIGRELLTIETRIEELISSLKEIKHDN